MWWHALQHWLGVDNASGRAYLAWSGSGSDLSEIALLGGAFSIWRRFTCHTWWCPRPGHYDLTDSKTGLTHRLCRRCHPAHPGTRLTRNHIARIYQRNRGGSDGPES